MPKIPFSRLLLNNVVPLVMILVALVQLYNVQQGLNRWKGGGFGMYSELHHELNEVIILSPKKDSLIDKNKIVSITDDITDLENELKIFPNKTNAERLYKQLVAEGLNKFIIQVWKPMYSNQNKSFERKLLLEYQPGKSINNQE